VVERHDALVHALSVVLCSSLLHASPALAEDAGPPEPAVEPGPSAPEGHVLVEVSAGAVRVTEVYALAAASRVGPRGGVGGAAWIPLPAGADELVVERGGDLLGYVPGGLVLVAALEPGPHTIAYSFVVAATGGRAAIAHELPFGVDALRVIWRDEAGTTVRVGGGFVDRGVLEMGPRRMRLLEREAFPPGGRLELETAGGPAPGADADEARPALATPRSPVLPLIGALAAFLLAAALAPLLSRSRPASKD
jgi:hypothetical protein